MQRCEFSQSLPEIYENARKRVSTPEKKEQWLSRLSISQTKRNDFEIVDGRARSRCKCIICGKVFYAMPWEKDIKKVCGLSCVGKLGGAKKKEWCDNNKAITKEIGLKSRKGEYRTCPVCKKEFYLAISETKKRSSFCSQACYSSTNRDKFNCIDCGNEFEIPKSCNGKVKRCLVCRKKHPNYYSRKPLLKCPVLNQE